MIFRLGDRWLGGTGFFAELPPAPIRYALLINLRLKGSLLNCERDTEVKRYG